MALQHPFISGLSFDPSFVPIPDMTSDTSKSAIPQYVFFLLKNTRNLAKNLALQRRIVHLLQLKLDLT